MRKIITIGMLVFAASLHAAVCDDFTKTFLKEFVDKYKLSPEEATYFRNLIAEGKDGSTRNLTDQLKSIQLFKHVPKFSFMNSSAWMFLTFRGSRPVSKKTFKEIAEVIIRKGPDVLLHEALSGKKLLKKEWLALSLLLERNWAQVARRKARFRYFFLFPRPKMKDFVKKLHENKDAEIEGITLVQFLSATSPLGGTKGAAIGPKNWFRTIFNPQKRASYEISSLIFEASKLGIFNIDRAILGLERKVESMRENLNLDSKSPLPNEQLKTEPNQMVMQVKDGWLGRRFRIAELQEAESALRYLRELWNQTYAKAKGYERQLQGPEGKTPHGSWAIRQAKRIGIDFPLFLARSTLLIGVLSISTIAGNHWFGNLVVQTNNRTKPVPTVTETGKVRPITAEEKATLQSNITKLEREIAGLNRRIDDTASPVEFQRLTRINDQLSRLIQVWRAIQKDSRESGSINAREFREHAKTHAKLLRLLERLEPKRP